MKMNRLFVTGALLLGSLSALGVGVSKNISSNSNYFRIAEMDSKDVLRANQTREVNTNPNIKPTEDEFVKDGDANNVTRAVTQTKPGKEANTTDIRFVAAVSIGLEGNEAEHRVDKINDGGQFGFHIKFNNGTRVVNVNADTSKYYVSLEENNNGVSTKYAANGFTKIVGEEGVKTMNDWTLAATGKENHADNQNGLGFICNAFITMEVRNVPNDFASYIEAQPYFIEEKSEKKHFASQSKKADTSGIELTLINTPSGKIKMERNKNKNERKYTENELTLSGTQFSIEDSYGNVMKNLGAHQQAPAGFDSSTGIFTPTNSKRYKFYVNFDQNGIYITEEDFISATIGERTVALEKENPDSTQYITYLDRVKKNDIISIKVNGNDVNYENWNGNNTYNDAGTIKVSNSARGTNMYLKFENGKYFFSITGKTNDQWHLRGTMNDWKNNDAFGLEFNQNNEFVMEFQLKTGDNFKICKNDSWNDADVRGYDQIENVKTDWFDRGAVNTGDNNNIIVKKDGKYRIFVKTNGKLYIEEVVA